MSFSDFGGPKRNNSASAAPRPASGGLLASAGSNDSYSSNSTTPAITTTGGALGAISDSLLQYQVRQCQLYIVTTRETTAVSIASVFRVCMCVCVCTRVCCNGLSKLETRYRMRTRK